MGSKIFLLHINIRKILVGGCGFFVKEDYDMMQCPGFLHVVEAGDTLYLLSRRYRVPLSLILLANPYVNVYNLQPGDEICIPVPKRPGKCAGEDLGG